MLQGVKEEWERKVLKNCFTSDLQVSQELDAIAGTSGAKSFTKATIFEFLRSKGWDVNELAEVADPELEKVADQDLSLMGEFQMVGDHEDSPLPPSLPLAGPRTHIVFDSSSENGEGSAPPSLTGQAKTTGGADDDADDSNRKADDDDDDDDENYHDDDDDDDDDDEKPSFRAVRSTYVGRGNVQAVRAARKIAGLSDAFPKSDPLLVEFGSFLRQSGAAEKDIANKASQVSKLLKYLSSLQTVTSEQPPAAEAKLLCNTSMITVYYDKLSQPPISLKPSAMKNELNAALRFITFIRRSRNLLVTDRTFYDTLENTKDKLTTFQEGTLKQINKDRNKKTTINIQVLTSAKSI